MWALPVLLQPPLLPEARSFVGVLFAIGGNTVISFGLNLQKLSHNELRRATSRPSTTCPEASPLLGRRVRPDSPLQPPGAREMPSQRRSKSPSSQLRRTHDDGNYDPCPTLCSAEPSGRPGGLLVENVRREDHGAIVSAVPSPSSRTASSAPIWCMLSESAKELVPNIAACRTFAPPIASPYLSRSLSELHDHASHPPSTFHARQEALGHRCSSAPLKFLDSRALPRMTATCGTLNPLDAREPAYDHNYVKSKSWWMGMLLMVMGEMGNFAAYGFAPASAIAPLGTVTLISNALLAHFMLKENIRKQDFLGIMFAVCGAIVVVLSSKASETQLSPEVIISELRQARFIIYVICTLIVGAVMLLLSETAGHKYSVFDLTLVAIFGGYTVLSTKAISSLLEVTSVRMFEYGITYFLLIVLVTTAILQIKYLNKALQRFDSTEVIPTQWTLFTLSVIIGSGVLYNDFDQMTPSKATMFVTGCAVTFFGVYFITANRNTVDLGLLTPSGSVLDIRESDLVWPPGEPSLAVTLGHREPLNLPAASRLSRSAALRRMHGNAAAAARSLVVSPLTSPSTLAASSAAATNGGRMLHLSASAPAAGLLHAGTLSREQCSGTEQDSSAALRHLT